MSLQSKQESLARASGEATLCPMLLRGDFHSCSQYIARSEFLYPCIIYKFVFKADKRQLNFLLTIFDFRLRLMPFTTSLIFKSGIFSRFIFFKEFDTRMDENGMKEI